ncbi:MAG: 6,7-dimethyl-8-ribityllumazine synthase [Planctomycetota bacterium]
MSEDPRPIAVVVSRYNRAVTDALEDSAVRTIRARGGRAAVVDAPGAYELPPIAARCIESGAYQGVVALGCIVRGETRHDRYIAAAIANGLTSLSIGSGVPVAFGVITAETPEQASARAGGDKGNKGEEAASALLDTIAAFDAIDHAVDNGTPERVEPVITPERTLPDKTGGAA